MRSPSIRVCRGLAALVVLAGGVAPLACADTTLPTGGGQAFDNRQPSMALDMCVSPYGVFGSGVPIRMFAYDAPSEWDRADGRLLSVTADNFLFLQIGTVYGGDGTTTFALPDLRGRVAVGVGQGPGLTNYNVGWTIGQPTVTLTAAQIPAHQHTVECNRLTQAAGEGLAHDTRQESIAMRWSIAQSGSFPPRPRDAGGQTREGGAGRGITGSPVSPYSSQMALHAAEPAAGTAFTGCDGRIVNTFQNNGLFALLGTTFGGAFNGSTFGYPDLRGRTAVGLGEGAPVGPYAWGQQAGTEAVAMNVFEMPLHTHGMAGAPDTFAAGFGVPMENRQPVLAIRWCIAVEGVYPAGPGTDDQYLYVGEVVPFACGYAPSGFMDCDGRLLSVASHPVLAGLLGNRYGGDGVSTFRLPDLRGRVVVGAGNGLAVGAVFGNDRLALDVSNLPEHAHGLAEACPGDMNGDGLRDTADLPAFLGVFGLSLPAGTCGDLNADGIINTPDLAVFLGGFGQPCP